MIIMTSCQGQLGNQIILFSHFIAFAIENDSAVINLNFNQYAHLFETTNKSFVSCYPDRTSLLYNNKLLAIILQRLVSRSTRAIDKYQIGVNLIKVIKDYDLKEGKKFDLDDVEFQLLLKPGQLIVSHGYLFRAYSLLEKYSNEIREYFTPIRKHSDNVSYFIDKIRKNADVLVGVHIRQGDYNNFLNGRYFYTIEQYVQMMKQIQNLFPNKNVKFLVCSNTKQEEGNFEEFNFSFGTNHLLEDMYSLANCDYIIGPPSSYTGWAAFYGQAPLYAVNGPDSKITLESFQIYSTPPV